jgi:DNA-binding NarL/FixJ family response regulator
MSDPVLRVILVEDSARIRARIAESLSEMPNVRIAGEAETEREAISLLERGDWDAVVLDLQLKQGTGISVLKALRKLARAAGTRVIVFTNYSFPQYRERSMALGADFFFDKSRDFNRVREVLADMAGSAPAAG